MARRACRGCSASARVSTADDEDAEGSDVMRILNSSESAAYALMRKLPHVRLGKRGVRLTDEMLRRFIESQQRVTQPVEHPEVVERGASVERAARPRRRNDAGCDSRSVETRDR